MNKYNYWRDSHYKAIDNFLKYLNSNTEEIVLKGGTALLACYNLDCFSTDILQKSSM